jgi:hypothetical protein
MNICSFNGCGLKAHSKGLCASHWRQKHKGLELKPLQLQHHGLSLLDRFEARFRKRDGCWNWTASLNNKGYGQFYRDDKRRAYPAHRMSYELYKEKIPEGMNVLHKCDNPRCVNPDHLFLGTQQDNVSDMWAKNRARPGVSKGENHGMSKLTNDLVSEIRSSEENGPAIARRLNISTTQVYDIRNRKIWKHIP